MVSEEMEREWRRLEPVEASETYGGAAEEIRVISVGQSQLPKLPSPPTSTQTPKPHP